MISCDIWRPGIELKSKGYRSKKKNEKKKTSNILFLEICVTPTPSQSKVKFTKHAPTFAPHLPTQEVSLFYCKTQQAYHIKTEMIYMEMTLVSNLHEIQKIQELEWPNINLTKNKPFIYKSGKTKGKKYIYIYTWLRSRSAIYLKHSNQWNKDLHHGVCIQTFNKGFFWQCSIYFMSTSHYWPCAEEIHKKYTTC